MGGRHRNLKQFFFQFEANIEFTYVVRFYMRCVWTFYKSIIAANKIPFNVLCLARWVNVLSLELSSSSFYSSEYLMAFIYQLKMSNNFHCYRLIDNISPILCPFRWYSPRETCTLYIYNTLAAIRHTRTQMITFKWQRIHQVVFVPLTVIFVIDEHVYSCFIACCVTFYALIFVESSEYN